MVAGDMQDADIGVAVDWAPVALPQTNCRNLFHDLPLEEPRGAAAQSELPILLQALPA